MHPSFTWQQATAREKSNREQLQLPEFAGLESEIHCRPVLFCVDLCRFLLAEEPALRRTLLEERIGWHILAFAVALVKQTRRQEQGNLNLNPPISDLSSRWTPQPAKPRRIGVADLAKA
jgi:hypothetical protein